MEYTIENIQVKLNHDYTKSSKYVISGVVNGTPCWYYTNDSEIYDWYDDRSDADRYEYAISSCESSLIEAFTYLNK